MKLLKSEIKNIPFYYREGTSDYKTFKEVIERNEYQKKYFKIEDGEHWLDLGGSVGAFTLLAASKGATVDVYEPDPYSFKVLEKNIRLHNIKNKVRTFNKAVDANGDQKKILYAAKNNNFWRNSLIKKWTDKGVEVKCEYFKNVIKNGSCVKMDIEGSEMEILENLDVKPKKLVAEWSFDIDRSLNRYWDMLQNIKHFNDFVKAEEYSKAKKMGQTIFPSNWFPPCTKVYITNYA